MRKYLAVILGGLVLAAGSAACYFHHRANVVERELAGLRASLASAAVSRPVASKPSSAVEKPKSAPEDAQSEAKPSTASALPFEVESVKYDNGRINIEFLNPGSGPLTAPDKDALAISPALATSFRITSDGVTVTGDFRPNTLYTATLSKDWRTADGRTLGRETRVSVRTPKPDPVFSMLSCGRYYPVARAGALRFPCETRLVTNLEVTLYRAFENNLNHYRPESWDANERMAEIAKCKLTLPPPYGETVNRMLELDNLITNRTPGVYRAVVRSDARQRNWWGGWGAPIEEDFSFALTDLGVGCAFDEKTGRRAFVSVSRLSTGRPVSGAVVTLLSRKNRIVATGVTREDGSVLIAFDPAYDHEHDQLNGVLAKLGGDVCYMLLDRGTETHASSATGDFALPRAFLFAERDLCRPGESFESAVFVRSAAKAGSEAFANAALDLVFIDREGTEVASRRVTTDRYGYAAAKWSVPADGAAGRWRVVCRLGKRELGAMAMRVASFTADRFRVKLESDHTEWVGLDSNVAFTGDAQYYFGEKVDEAEWKFTARLFPAPAPRHWQGWTAGAAEPFEAEKFTRSGTVANGSFKTKFYGVAAMGVKQAFAPVLVAAEASVTEPGGRSVTATRRLTAFPTDRFIGVREAEAKPGEARALEFALLTATPDTVVVNETESEIELTFEKSEWDSHYVRRNDTYVVEWREEQRPMPKLSRRVHLPLGAAAATWRARVAFAAADLLSGHYILTARIGAKVKTVYDFWHWQGEVGERSTSPAALDLMAGAERYRPGDVAELSFNVPYSGRAYVVAGAGTVEYSASVPVKPGANTVHLAIPAGCVAGRYYALVTFVTEGTAKLHRLSGLACIKLDNSAGHRLDVGCRVPELGRPGSDAEIAVTLADSSGKPRAGLVRLVACDTGVLALTGYATPDPYSFFFGRDFGCPFAMHDLYSSIYPELKLLPNGQIGGGADTAMISFNRRDSNAKRKATAVVVAPPVAVPPSGRATVKVKLPDHTGSLRFMAVAADAAATGSADAEMMIRHPATVLLSAPRYACGGDRFTFTAQLFNHDLAAEEWTLRVKLPEGLAADDGHELVRRGRLLKGCTEVIKFELTASDAVTAGAGRIAAELAIGGERIQEETFVTLRHRRPVETRVEYFVATNGMPSLAPVEAEWLKAERRVETSASPAFAVKDSLAWLNSYPYGCLEQTCAGAFPFLAADDLKSLGFISDAEYGMARRRVEAAYAHVMQMRLEDGGFAMWPSGEEVWTEGSLFACHFIFEAERSGLLKLDGERRGELLDYLESVISDLKRGKGESRAYAAYALAVAGDERFLNPARNLCRAERPDWTTFLAASALIRGGYAAEGLEGYNAAVAARAWGGNDHSARRLGMALFIASHSGLAEDAGKLMPIVVELNRRLRADGTAWGTTQDNAWAAAGLASFLNGSAPGESTKFVRVVTTGVPKSSFAMPGPVKIRRRYLNAEGKAAIRARKGELVTVELILSTPDAIERAVVCDLLPAGLELEDDTFLTRSQPSAAAVSDGDAGYECPQGRSELRDDRYLWFGELSKLPEGKSYRILYRARAVTAGVFAVPAVTVEDMYDPDLRGRAEGEGAFTVE